MRRKIGIIYNMRAGDTARILCSLPNNLDSSGIAIFSRENGEEFSPYIPIIPNEIVGPPKMLNPLFKRLFRDKPKAEIEFMVNSKIDIAIMQECDLSTDPLVNIRIKADGTIIQKIGRFFRNSIWKCRRFYVAWFHR